MGNDKADKIQKSTTLADALPKEIERCQEVIRAYESIGPAGYLVVAHIKSDISIAHEAMMEMDIVKMLKAYRRLKEWEM